MRKVGCDHPHGLALVWNRCNRPRGWPVKVTGQIVQVPSIRWCGALLCSLGHTGKLTPQRLLGSADCICSSTKGSTSM